MKIKIEREVDVCDFCESKEITYDNCLECGKAICYDCLEKVAVKYSHSLHFAGSLDGVYCTHCVAKLSDSGKNELFNKYLELGVLKAELTAFHSKARSNGDLLETEIEHLRRAKR